MPQLIQNPNFHLFKCEKDVANFRGERNYQVTQILGYETLVYATVTKAAPNIGQRVKFEDQKDLLHEELPGVAADNETDILVENQLKDVKCVVSEEDNQRFTLSARKVRRFIPFPEKRNIEYLDKIRIYQKDLLHEELPGVAADNETDIIVENQLKDVKCVVSEEDNQRFTLAARKVRRFIPFPEKRNIEYLDKIRIYPGITVEIKQKDTRQPRLIPIRSRDLSPFTTFRKSNRLK
ncbi:hypothetical protein FGIG_01402 [Fasciola gigantica]|uniref:Uncharacterized protein n=1 Tax=Fasciola gigantica TaxID=46835 RepID=A0A504YPZ6_FASGI|nr:hypothetical protein FGIG_01402 [Fasciola gigantica]